MDAIIVDIPEEVLPGAGFDFKDVTDVFQEAAADMEPGSFVFMDDLTLYDAMGAFEVSCSQSRDQAETQYLKIGEPRLDSGLISENNAAPPFNPTAPLLPQEICWIMDRALTYEMEWHSGNPLCHSVFTLLYIHAMAAIDPEYVTQQEMASFDSSRPPELVFQILRSWVMGLLKCCDLSWRELSKGGVQDTEDWQGDKCDVSLLEGTPVKYVLSKLEDASMWLHRTTNKYQTLIDAAREQLMIIRSHPASSPDPPSAALHSFDSSIARSLKTIVPIRILPIPPPEDTWNSVERLLDGWQELSLLAQAHSLSTWEAIFDYGCLIHLIE
ncbi:hypothetical protein H0H87_000457 [Tephrocybe sp. NHM501043]|nr:hypothetical protein H0H87_000457 [Tephrocybe sp. NHM501043]